MTTRSCTFHPCQSKGETYLQGSVLIKVKKYKKTSRATSNVGYQTNYVFESASSSALVFDAQFIYLFCAQFVYLFSVVISTLYGRMIR